ncbi:2'-5' RNA ligase family protein [Hymenobacter sp. CRA2]|uniref:2'-5' RNA ligase family protein n=1 Tax=Hymenobacter sp. CRA2 TaxID=1955620 RepID=UPI0009D55725|nr:2'-5' RNA ligase family protein [Hymenobacter sp. CRA2]OON67424.1 hypothetical protein B0919_18340 [Hymenobacter sp. CRA2]
MDLATHYAAMWARALPQLQANALRLDAPLDDPQDARRGLTLIARPDAALQAAVQELLAELRALEPEQYYYPLTDLHVTVLTPLSAVAGFRLEHVDAAAYSRVIATALARVPAFSIDFRGLTLSAEAVLLQGFPQGTALSELRATLRAALMASGLPQTVDQRYVLQTAHTTVMRFRRPLREPGAFRQALERWRAQPFGAVPVYTLELVYNDWCHRRASVQPLAEFSLPGPQILRNR